MSQWPSFSAEEEWEFRELSLQKAREGQFDDLKNNVPLSKRYKLWLLEQERQRILGLSVPQQNEVLCGGPERTFGPRSLPGLPATSADISLPLSKVNHTIGSSNDGIYSRSPGEASKWQSGQANMFLSQGSFRCDIQMHGKNGWKPLKAILDTGTEENWISQRIVDRLRLDARHGLTTKGTTFDGTIIESESAVNPTWCVENGSNTYQTRFHIAPKEAPFEVLIGSNLIESGEVQFFEGRNPIQVLASSKIKQAEQEQIKQNEAAMKDRQLKLSSQTQEVKRSTRTSKNTKGKPDKKQH